MSLAIDKDAIKMALLELKKVEPDTFKNLINEVLHDETIISDEADFEQKAMNSLQKNFKRFDKTFKALA